MRKSFDESVKVVAVPFYIPGFNLLGCKLDNFMFKVYNTFIAL